MHSRRVSTFLVSAVAAALGFATLRTAGAFSDPEPERNLIPADRLWFFAVPLACPAVKDLGCGSLAGPLMLQIERHPEVSRVWINRSGTILAVAQKNGGDPRGPTVAVEAAFSGRGMDASPLDRAALGDARRDFASSSSKWYGAADVDRLSETEAQVVAKRIIDRVEKRGARARDPRAFREELAAAFHHCFVGGCTVGMKEVLSVAARYLDVRGVARFRDSLEDGLAPLAGER